LCKGGDDAGLVFVLNHAVFDGTSRNQFLHYFLSHLSQSNNHLPLEHSNETIDVKALVENMKTMAWPTFVVYLIHGVWNNLRGMRHEWTYPLGNAPGISDPACAKQYVCGNFAA